MNTETDTLVINGETYQRVRVKEDEDDYVVVRSRDQGVVTGYLVSFDPAGRHVELRNARQLWRWSGGLTLFEVAQHGPKEGSRLSCESDKTFLVMGACGLYRCSEKAKKAIRDWPEDMVGR